MIKNVYTHTVQILTVFLFVFVLSFLFVHPTLADSISIGTAPTSEKLKLVPGQKYNGELVVWNLTDKAIDYNVVIRGFKQIENQPGTAILLTEEEDTRSLYTATSWLKASVSELTLVPNKNEKIYYEINVPANATKGEYTVMISFTSKTMHNYQVQELSLPYPQECSTNPDWRRICREC
jgi:hypothetical protein